MAWPLAGAEGFGEAEHEGWIHGVLDEGFAECAEVLGRFWEGGLEVESGGERPIFEWGGEPV